MDFTKLTYIQNPIFKRRLSPYKLLWIFSLILIVLSFTLVLGAIDSLMAVVYVTYIDAAHLRFTIYANIFLTYDDAFYNSTFSESTNTWSLILITIVAILVLSSIYLSRLVALMLLKPVQNS